MKPAKPLKPVAEAKNISTSRIERVFRFRDEGRTYRAVAVALSAALLFAYALFKTYNSHNEPAQLHFIENPNGMAVERAPDLGQPSTSTFSGEPHDTAQRLRESGALLMAISLSAFEEFRNRGSFPLDISQLLTRVQGRLLVPPGIEIRDGEFRSLLSELEINYRSDPFSFEIFSSPARGVRGPAMLFRFPLPPSGAKSVLYFESATKPGPPAPFSSTEQLAATGWTIHHWRGEALSLDEAAVRDLNATAAWFKSQGRNANK